MHRFFLQTTLRYAISLFEINGSWFGVRAVLYPYPKTFATIAWLLVSRGLLAQNVSLSREDFHAGRFGAPLARELTKSPAARAELVRCCDSIIRERTDLDQWAEGLREGTEIADVSEEERYDRFKQISLTKLLSFVAEHKADEAALTGKLMAARLTWGEHKDAHTAGIRMLDEIMTEQPPSWQAKIAPFIKATLIADGPREIPEDVRLRAAADAVRHVLDDPNATLPMNDPEVRAFLKLCRPIVYENPLRVDCIMNLACCEYSIAQRKLERGEQEPEAAMLTASKLYQQVIDEYPDSMCARDAKQMLGSIDFYLRRAEDAARPEN
ncbi:MAG TPA: hypothetical protein VGM03_20270 [Phycisphaerae bacterium]|jgi:hypothetical protein